MTIFCPSCQADLTPHFTGPRRYGKRSCPACHASILVTRDGCKLPPGIVKRADVRRTANANVKRLFTVLDADGTVLCACCGAVTNLAEGLDGRITTGAQSSMRVQVGTEIYAEPGTLRLMERPRFETRQLPANIRGVLCPVCVVTWNAQPVRQTALRGARVAKRSAWKTSGVMSRKRYERFSMQWNPDEIAAIQAHAQATEAGILAMHAWLLSGRTPDYGLFLTHEGLYSGLRWYWSTKGNTWVIGPREWFRNAGESHPVLCGCVSCHSGRRTVATVRERMLRHIVRRIAAPSGSAPFTAGIGRASVSIAQTFIGHPVVRSRRSPVITINGKTWLRLHGGQSEVHPVSGHITRHVAHCASTCACARPRVRFGSRPLPKRAIALRPVS